MKRGGKACAGIYKQEILKLYSLYSFMFLEDFRQIRDNFDMIKPQGPHFHKS